VVADLLALTAGLPEVVLAEGDVLIHDGTTTGSVWVLVEGALDIRKDGALINTIAEPGAAFGEISVLLGAGHSADVVAASPCRLRHAVDGRSFLLDRPEVLLLVAAGLARRLDLVTRYLADLRNQYAGTPGLEMVADVLQKLNAPGEPARPGSARDPDPEY
jgi:CRP/FNR family cyclic AMP-dependent transcriptional regulator